jgi:hypothetical protein
MVVTSHRPIPLVTCRRAREWDDGTITHRYYLCAIGVPLSRCRAVVNVNANSACVPLCVQTRGLFAFSFTITARSW